MLAYVIILVMGRCFITFNFSVLACVNIEMCVDNSIGFHTAYEILSSLSKVTYSGQVNVGLGEVLSDYMSCIDCVLDVWNTDELVDIGPLSA